MNLAKCGCPADAWRAAQSVTCHEPGHWFVLNHRQPSNSCMVAGSVFPNFPDEHGFNQIYDIYGHSH